MDAKLVSLIAASAAFVGSHFVLSHPLRSRVVAAVGPAGFQGVYSLFAFASLGWMVMAFLAGWNLVGTALGLVALILVGWAGGELR